MEGNQCLGVEEESLERQGNANILKLCHFEVYSTCCCGDDDCDCTELRCFRPTKIRPLFETSARRVRPPDKIVKDARRILKKNEIYVITVVLNLFRSVVLGRVGEIMTIGLLGFYTKNVGGALCFMGKSWRAVMKPMRNHRTQENKGLILPILC